MSGWLVVFVVLLSSLFCGEECDLRGASPEAPRLPKIEPSLVVGMGETILDWLPVKDSYVDVVLKVPVMAHDEARENCRYRAWYMGSTIHLCAAQEEYEWLFSHELTHHFVYQNISLKLRPETADWDKFGQIAIRTLSRHCTDEEFTYAKYVVRNFGEKELHAELPWIVKGNIPPDLRAWYPWIGE